MKFMNSKAKETEPRPEKIRSRHYYEHDGALRAYANRAMVLAFLCLPTTLIAVAFAAYVRLQPPTIIRVDQNGEAVVVGPKSGKIGVAQSTNQDAADFERVAVAKRFLDHYLNFSPDSVNRNWADALNMMTSNLRRGTLSALQKNNSAGKVQDDQITSVFHLRSIEAAKDDPLTLTVFGVKEVHRIRDHRESTDKLVGEYRIRLVPERRSEDNPSGLLIAEYGERLITGERADTVGQGAPLDASSENKN